MLEILYKSIKGGSVAALNRYFESNQCEEIPNLIKKQLKIMMKKFGIKLMSI